ncbi:MAG: hypothetical protein HW380_3577 [Magnetococcales bacterium]|nr:hypothetical protein [Magnetococcales bacterium]HIJ84123.1 hypothetical protein [Magnetococcales bacterium]
MRFRKEKKALSGEKEKSHHRESGDSIFISQTREIWGQYIHFADGELVKDLNRMLVGWANYFSMGLVRKGYRAVMENMLPSPLQLARQFSTLPEFPV